MTDSDRYQVPAVVSAIRLMRALARPDNESVSQSDLARELGLSKSTAHNLLVTLEDHGLVDRDRTTRHYHLGPGLISLGRAAAQQVQLVSLAIERLAPLASQLGLSFAVVYVTSEGYGQVIDRAYPPTDVHVGIALGSRYGIFDGAIGKCLLAAMTPREAEGAVRNTPIPARTKATITTPSALLDEVATVQLRGWAASVQEYNENNAVAVPLYGPTGDLELMLLALGFPGQLPSSTISKTGGLLRDVADSVTVACGGTPPEFSEPESDATKTTGPEWAQETAT